jgi:hypothetical protein
LRQAQLAAVVLRPRQADQIALPLPSPQREQQRELQCVGGDRTEFRDVVRGPDDLGPIGLIETPAALAHIDGDDPAVFGD